MNFPSDSAVINYLSINPLLLFLALVILGIGLVFAVWFVFSYRESKKYDLQLAGIAIVFTLLPTLIIYSTYREVTDEIAIASQFRIDPARISEIRIERIEKEGRLPVGSVITLTDRVLISNGFTQLATTRGHFRNHETFVDGYQIQIKLDNAATYSNLYYSVFKGSDWQNIPVVILHTAPNDTLGVSDEIGGIYECPTFYQWIVKNVEPLFTNS